MYDHNLNLNLNVIVIKAGVVYKISKKIRIRINTMPIAQLAGSESTNDPSKSKTFVFQDEGHTLGNALRCVIANNPDVEFCGYTVPHPAESKMHFRIQMRRGKAIDALKRGLEDLVQVCNVTMQKFDEELSNA